MECIGVAAVAGEGNGEIKRSFSGYCKTQSNRTSAN
jgi:hypothetical protein